MVIFSNQPVLVKEIWLISGLQFDVLEIWDDCLTVGLPKDRNAV